MSDASVPTLLAIDTSGPRLQLALVGDGMSEIRVEDIAKGHAEILFDRIGELLAHYGTSYQHLTRLAVTTGPGSFTGLRIGISAARGLGLALNLPVIGVPNLLALSLGSASGPVDVRVDARRDEFYAQRFSAPGVPETEPELLPAGTAADHFARSNAILITNPQVDISAMAKFALTANPADIPPNPTYIRQADAKPQTKNLIARADETQ